MFNEFFFYRVDQKLLLTKINPQFFYYIFLTFEINNFWNIISWNIISEIFYFSFFTDMSEIIRVQFSTSANVLMLLKGLMFLFTEDKGIRYRDV